MSFTVVPTDDLDMCLALRIKVFVEEQGVPLEMERDADDDSSQHYLAWLDDQAVGTARVIRDGTLAKIGRVCLLPKARGGGRGAALIRAILSELEQNGDVSRVALGAQVSAIGFYEALGFEAYGEDYDDAGIPHRNMARSL